jgi:gamma-glutamyltranspeptidase/glutathione hydrolase
MVGVVSMMVFLALIRTLSIEWIRNCSTSSHLNTLTRQLQPQNKTGAVASISTQCSNIGATIIEQEGNAADAIVSMAFCLGLMTPWVSGLGGGGIALIRSSNGSYEYVDYRETAPAAAFEDMYNDDVEASVSGGLASGVPGELRGLEYIHKHYGHLSWSDVLQPVIDAAYNGFIVSEDLSGRMDQMGPHSFLETDPAWAVDYAPNGTRVGTGDIMTRKRYASLLEKISIHGASSFYSGAVAQSTITALAKANGTMTMEDLAGYRIQIRPVEQIKYRQFKLSGCSAPAGGPVLFNIMKTIEGYSDFGASAGLDLDIHRLVEAMKFGYGLRTKLGDPEFVPEMKDYQRWMLLDDTAREIRSKISDDHTLTLSDYNPDGLEILQTPGTSHAVAADASGLAISLTATLNLLFGSKLMVPETGVIMNNQMNDFSIPNTKNAFGLIPSAANYIRPGKRPLSSMSPVIVELDDKLFLVIGGAGGSRIVTAVAQSLWHVLDQKMTATEAIAAPRLHHQLVPDFVEFEYAYSNRSTTFLRTRGHNITWVAPDQSVVQALMRMEDGAFEAAADPRLADTLGRVI